MRAIGLMSGTSLDGIDVADVDIEWSGGRPRLTLLHFATTPMSASLRDAAIELMPPHCGDTAAVCALNYALGEAFAQAVLSSTRAWGVALSGIDIVGSHGQTVLHAPGEGSTLQIGEPAVIAARTGLTCVADFRAADVASGGQGAPLVSFVDRELFGSDVEYRVALNIGGIANVTLLPPPGSGEGACAFDTGPGNMVIDACVRETTAGRRSCDEGGAMAARGRPHGALLWQLLTHPYFSAAPPKSTGRETFGADYARDVTKRARDLGLGDEDLVATVTALTARTVAAAIPATCARVIAAGGGVHNVTLMDMLRAELARRGTTSVDLSDAYGIPADAKEAMAFALLAAEAVQGRPNQIPACTGARRACVLGKIVPGDNFGDLMKRLWAPAVC